MGPVPQLSVVWNEQKFVSVPPVHLSYLRLLVWGHMKQIVQPALLGKDHHSKQYDNFQWSQCRNIWMMGMVLQTRERVLSEQGKKCESSFSSVPIGLLSTSQSLSTRVKVNHNHHTSSIDHRSSTTLNEFTFRSTSKSGAQRHLAEWWMGE